MSVESEILRIQHNIANAYAAVAGKGGEVPLQPTSENLAAAVASIPSAGSGGGAPIGSIVIWSGTTDNIPTGWALCDGQDGRPDLRDRFVLGAGTAHNVGETGGSEEVALTVSQMPSHNHKTYYANVLTTSGTSQYVSFANTLGAQNLFTSDTGYTGNSLPHPNMPPYYTLCYIIKISADETDGITMDQVNEAINAAISGAIEEAY